MDFVYSIPPDEIRMIGIEHSVACILDLMTREKQQQQQQQQVARVDAGTQTESCDLMVFPTYNVAVATPTNASPQGEVFQLTVNESMYEVSPEDSSPDIKDYYNAMLRKLRNVTGRGGKRLITPKRSYSQVMLARTLIFLNRPPCYINLRWTAPRCVLKDIDELAQFISSHKNVISDFCLFAKSGRLSDNHIAPGVRSEEELKKPYQRKNVLRAWAGNLVF